MMASWWMAAAAALLTAAPLFSQAAHGVEGLDNPFNTPDDVAAGGRIFRSHCGVCHGPDGTGGSAADLSRGYFRHGNSDTELYRVISNGIPGTEMPGTFFEGRQIWQIVAYVRSLSEGKAAGQTDGDPREGERIFFGKGGCDACHMAQGRGGRSGPDLSMVGGQRSLAYLETSILRPEEHVPPRYWFVRAEAADGTKYYGRRLNEDTHTVQLLDSGERLVSLRKAGLAKYEVLRESTMPPYEEAFSEQELENLLAYLASLN